MNFALAKDKSVLSVHLEETTLPVGLEFSLSDMQAVFRYDYAEQAYRDKVKLSLDSLLPKQTLKIAGYEIDRMLERVTGFTRYVATHIKLKREVVITVLDSDTTDHDPGVMDAFILEAQALAAVDQLTVMSVFDSGVIEGERYMVSQYSEGTSLQHLIHLTHFQEAYESVSSITPLQILGLVRDIAIILNLVDRNFIKLQTIDSANLLVRPDGSVQLIGLGYLTNAIHLVRFRNVNTYGRYLSPEEQSGEPANPTSRVYSLGRIYMEIVSGVLPIQPFLTQSNLLERIGNLPENHQELLSRMLSPAADRIASCFDLITAIDVIEPGLSKENLSREVKQLDVIRSFLTANHPDFRTILERALTDIIEHQEVLPESPALRQIADCLFSAGLFSAYLDFYDRYLNAMRTEGQKALVSLDILGRFDESLKLLDEVAAPQTPERLGEEIILLCKLGEFVHAEEKLLDFHFQHKKLNNQDYGFPDVFYLASIEDAHAARRLHEQLCEREYDNRFKLWGAFVTGNLNEVQDRLDHLIQLQVSPSPAPTLHSDLLRFAPADMMAELIQTPRYQAGLKRLGVDDAFCAETIERTNSVSHITGIQVAAD